MNYLLASYRHSFSVNSSIYLPSYHCHVALITLTGVGILGNYHETRKVFLAMIEDLRRFFNTGQEGFCRTEIMIKM